MLLDSQLLGMEAELSARRGHDELKLKFDSLSSEDRASRIRNFLSVLLPLYESLQSPFVFWPHVCRAESYVVGRYAYWRELLSEKDKFDFPDFSELISGDY